MFPRLLHDNTRQFHRSTAGIVRRAIRASVATTVVATLLIPAVVSTAGADTGCGTYSFGFPGTRLLNDGISDVAGPFPIELPAGVYVVTLVAHDHHDTQVGVPTQIGEQYVVELDSGYRSPPSTDIPDEMILTTTVFNGQVIGASSSITVRHAGVPGINSVDVVCVGFTPEVEVEVEGVVETQEPGPAAPVQPGAPEEPGGPTEPTVPGVVAPDPDAPNTDTPAEKPTQDIGDPVGIVRQPDPEPGPDPTPDDAPIQTEVQGIVETPPVAAQLAVTGPQQRAQVLLIVGGVLIVLGAALLRRQRRTGEVI